MAGNFERNICKETTRSFTIIINNLIIIDRNLGAFCAVKQEKRWERGGDCAAGYVADKKKGPLTISGPFGVGVKLQFLSRKNLFLFFVGSTIPMQSIVSTDAYMAGSAASI